ncbi:MAG: sugar phosphate isomerase/epimerase family protein [Microthrixaceae bacterium]
MPTALMPRDLRSDDIVLSHFTLGRHHDIAQRVDAAAIAGCKAIGLYVGDYMRLESDGVADSLVGLLDQQGLCLAEIDALRSWGDSSRAGTPEALQQEATAFRIADRFECRSLHVLAPPVGTTGDIAELFGALCDRAADHGLLVGLEFMPTTAVGTATDAQRIAEAADRPNGGLCVDMWHHRRGANDLDQIRAIPGELVVDVQLSDGPLVAALEDYEEDTRRNRVPPGDGEMDLRSFIEAIRHTGTTAPWSLEVCNAAAGETDGVEFVSRCVEGLRRLL